MKKLIFIALLLLALVFTCSACAKKDEVIPEGDPYNVKVVQVEKEQKFTLSWDKQDTLASIIVTVKHGDMIVAEQTIDGDAIAAGQFDIEAYYGKHSVHVITVNKDNTKAQTTKEVAISADEYVIAPISGSMPQLYFTLNMKEITNDYTIPTFVWLARPGSWNWDKLPENVYAMPTVDISEVLTHNNYDRMVSVTDAYIEELYSINPDAKFHLYINDYNTYLYPKLMAGNGISEENYTVVLLSDGGASYAEFQKAFNSEDPNFDADAKYAEMAQNLKTLMSEVRAANDYNWTQSFTIDTSTIRSYDYVIAKEMTNVEWWVLRPRKDTFICPDEEFIDALLANDVLKATNGVYENTENNVIVERNFNTPLTMMTEEEKATLKDFYSFNDEMFAEAEAQGKKAMMFLGSWASDTNEPDFYAYVNFMKAYYGDEFVYYYKGHPSTPTSNYPHKQQQLEDLGLIDVESSINAELILFFYPDIYMCGYNSSTFLSAEKDEMACAIFNMTQAGCTNDYAPRIGLFVSKIATENYAMYHECADATHSYFLVEFNNVESEYQYAIYDATANKIINGPSNNEVIPEADNYNTKVAQVEKEQKLTLTWDVKDTLKSLKVTVKHGDMVVFEQTLIGDALKAGTIDIDAYYGKHSVRVVTMENDGTKAQANKTVAISADEYVIAPISGSMPQLYFTLNMKEITNDYTIPTFVWLARPGSWDWNKLPQNVYAMPTVDISEVLTHNNYNRMEEVTDAYIEELYSINPDAKFHLYINDYNTYLYAKLMAGNGIPEENYTVVLLSDGGASYKEFQNAFNSEDANFDADAKYAEMAQNLQALMAEVREAKNYYWSDSFTVNTSEIRSYAYVIAKEMTNVEWWVLRPRTDTLISPDADFVAAILANDVLKATNGVYIPTENNVIVERNFNTPLTMMTEEEKDTLKEFYSFNDEMFAEAEAQGKKAMMFLGSWASDTNEPDFYAYVNFMKLYYGDEYVYYYKGHPSTPTSNYPHKQQQLEDLGLIDVESSINAELILFFYPDIYMCGYNSSTFLSAEKDEMACAIFNMTKEACMSAGNTYAERIGVYVSKIAAENYANYSECANAEHSYFLVEFNNVESNYQYAIYDATANVIINGPAK